MALIIFYLLILSISLFISIEFNKKIEKTFIISIMSIIFTTYLFGLIGILQYGVYFIFLISFLMLICNLYMIIKDKSKLYINIKGIAIFTILYLLIIIINNGRMVHVWDEFSHWGDVVKWMFDSNDFSTNPNSLCLFKSYPPAVSLFQYFFVRIQNSFNESYLYISYQLIAVSLFLPFLTKIKTNKNLFISLMICLLVPTIFFNQFYDSIYIDGILGLFAGYVILIQIMEKDYDKFFIVNTCLSLFVITLIKDVGIFFAILSSIILILNLYFKQKNIKMLFKNKKYLYIVLFALVSIFIAKMSWNVNISLRNAQVVFENNINLKSFFHY